MTDTDDYTYDVVVVGSGAAGLAAAVTARLRGLSVLVVEKTDKYGGSTALSGGAIWVPGNFHLDRAGLADTPEKARAYLDATVGDRVPAARKDAYLAHGPRMVEEFHDRTEIRFMYTPGYPDYFPEAQGGMAQGRSVEPCIVDLKRLGALVGSMRRAGLPTYGLTMTSYDFRFLNMVGRTWAGKKTSVKVGLRALKALATGRKPLSLGEALVARMRLSLDRLGGDLWLSAPLTGLLTDGGGDAGAELLADVDGDAGAGRVTGGRGDARAGRVTGVRVTGVRVLREGREVTVGARGGVVLASGGFSHDQALREKHLPAPTSTAWTHAAEGQSGDALRLGEELGAATDLLDKVWGAPSVCPPGEKPFFLVADRGIPGMVIVNGAGERYANEALPYHAFVDRMYAADRPGATTVPSWLILDARSKARYIFAGLFPGQPFPKQWLESGFLKKAGTVEELARMTSAPGLPAAVRRFNAFAEAGTDEDFGRGDSVYDRYYGDPTLPNPNLAPIEKGPFYAVPVHPGDIGTKGGLVTDTEGRVLREDSTPIAGLYAAGNCSAAVMGETYPGPGATIGPAMAFGWAAVNDIAGALGE
ncbi:3-ketosteroid-delta-1-dehydrogenase [Streptomyces avidinii]